MRPRGIVLVLAVAVLCASAASGYTPPTGPQQSTTGPVPPPGVAPKLRLPPPPGTRETVISGVPGYEWRHGCGPTAVGMILGYYDGEGYDDLIPGDAATQTEEVDQAIASERSAADPGHYEDYSEPLDDWETGILPDRSEPPAGDEHADDCVADFMKTSMSSWNNLYGWSYTTHIGSSFVDYIEMRDPDYRPSYAEHGIFTGELTWEVLTTEIDAGRPMCFLVDSVGDGATDHFVTVVGYRETPTQQYGCLDTWWPADIIRWCDFAPMAPGQEFGVFTGISLRPHAVITVDVGGGGEHSTIQPALDAAPDGAIVRVAPGTYTGDENRDLDFGGKDLVLESEAGAGETIIDCQGLGRGLSFHGQESPEAVVDGFTIRNGSAAAGGGVRCFFNTSPTLRNLVIEDCAAMASGGGVTCGGGSSPILEYVTIAGCSAAGDGGAIFCSSAVPRLTNVTIHGCSAGGNGGGIASTSGSSPYVENTIVAFSTSGEGVYCADGAEAIVTHSCIYGNAGGDSLCGARAENLFGDPDFCGAPAGDFTLRADSPCLPGNNEWDELVGAHGEGECGTGVGEEEFASAVLLHPASPNPFVGSTRLAFDVRSAGHARLAVYDISGRLVRTLVDGTMGPGRHPASWDGKDEQGRAVASGVYLARLEVGGEESGRKLLLVR